MAELFQRLLRKNYFPQNDFTLSANQKMVKQMKMLKLIVFYVLISTTCSQAKNDLPREYGYARSMTMMLSNNILLGGPQIPEGWSDFMQIDYMKREKISSAPYFKAFNSFALVPGSPVIKKDVGISIEYSGNRLFLISRYKIYTHSSIPGRSVILLYPSTTNKDQTNSAAFFIPETTAQIILAQIPGFDPIVQPLAFDDDFLVANKKKFQGDDLDSTIRAIEKDKRAEANLINNNTADNARPREQDIVQKKLQKIQSERDASPLYRKFSIGLVIGISVLGITFWAYLRIKKARWKAANYIP